MKLLFLLSTLVAVISVTRGIFFQTTSLGGQIQGDRQWQDFDQYGNSNEERYTYQNPGYQQYVDYQPQSYQHPSERLRPTQTLFHATQHLLQPAQQLLQPAQQLLQSGQHIYHNTQQNIRDPEHAFQLFPNYQLINGFQGSQLGTQNNVPLVVRLVENQGLLPVRAVYSLPPVLEKLVQRVQGYYSVYNAPEQLTLDRPLFTPTIAPPTTDLLATGISESSVISDSSPESSTAFPVHLIPSQTLSTEGQKIDSTTEATKQTTTGTSTTTSESAHTTTSGTSSTTTESPHSTTTGTSSTTTESPHSTTSGTSTTTTTTSQTTTSSSSKSPETIETSTTSATTTTSNKVSTLTVLEVTPTTTETEHETANSVHDTTTEEQTEQTTDPSNYISPDTMSPDVEM